MSKLSSRHLVLLFVGAFFAGGIVASVALSVASERATRAYLEVVRFAYVQQESEMADKSFGAGDTRSAVAHAYCAAFAYNGSDVFGEQAPPWHAGFLFAGVILREPTPFGPADPGDFAALQRARLGYVLERFGDPQASQQQLELAEKIGGSGTASSWKARAATSFSTSGPGREPAK